MDAFATPPEQPNTGPVAPIDTTLRWAGHVTVSPTGYEIRIPCDGPACASVTLSLRGLAEAARFAQRLSSALEAVAGRYVHDGGDTLIRAMRDARSPSECD